MPTPPRRRSARLYAALALAALTLAGLGCNHAPNTSPIPTLDTKADVYKTLGPNDPLIYDSTLGPKSAIVIFLDFPNIPQSQSTQERAQKVLGQTDGQNLFQDLFAKQSHGKLTIDLTLVHGWRRLPKENKTYDVTTTEGHRDLFVDCFALYPEINFHDYDYVMAIMTGRGNFAFGERDDQAIPYRGKFINVALNQGSQSPYVLAHETGHLMGLPDLYTYTNQVPDDAPRNPTGPWDIMSDTRRSSGFIGWHRHKLGWLSDHRKTYLTQGSHNLTLAPLTDPSDDAGLSMIVVPVDEPDKPSKVFVAEIAQPLRNLKPDQPVKPGGILVYSVDATLPTGQNPLIVYPRADKLNAAFHPGDTFDHPDAPFSLTVLRENLDGSVELKLDIKPN